MDNQQVTVDTQAAWVAALVDGEGSLAIYPSTSRTASLMTHINVISNSDPTLVATIASILDEWRVGRYVSMHKTPKLPSWRVDVRGYKRCLPFLQRTLPWLVSKRAEGELMYRLIEHRLSRPMRAPYSDVEEHLVRQFKDTKSTRHLRDFVPDPRYLRGEDKVHALSESGD